MMGTSNAIELQVRQDILELQRRVFSKDGAAQSPCMTVTGVTE